MIHALRAAAAALLRAAPGALPRVALALTMTVGPLAWHAQADAQTGAQAGAQKRGQAAVPADATPLARTAVEQEAFDEGCDMNQHNLHVCASYDFRVQDTRLNALYRQQMARLQNAPDDRKRLQDAQRAWLRYTDADCLYQNGPIEGSGSIWPMLELTCRIPHWKARIELLQSYVNCTQDGCKGD